MIKSLAGKKVLEQYKSRSSILKTIIYSRTWEEAVLKALHKPKSKQKQKLPITKVSARHSQKNFKNRSIFSSRNFSRLKTPN